MEIDDGGLETADALRFARLDRRDWNNAVQRQLYRAAPATEPGRPRVFTVDDLVAAYCLGWLFEREVLPRFACQIAADVLKAVRASPDVETLFAWKCFRRNGTPYVVVAETSPRPDSIVLFKFDVGDIRRRAIEGIREKLAAQEPNP